MPEQYYRGLSKCSLQKDWRGDLVHGIASSPGSRHPHHNRRGSKSVQMRPLPLSYYGPSQKARCARNRTESSHNLPVRIISTQLAS